MKIIFILLLAISLQADECIKCEGAIDDMIEAIEVNDKDKALELTDVIIKECNDLEASNLLEHLYNKIKNKQELSEYEKKDFYDLVNLSEPIRLYRGIKYDFREILVKVKNVQFWTISEKPNEEEKTIYESGPVYADWSLD